MLEKHVFIFNNALGVFTEFKYLCAEIAKENQDVKLSANLRKLANAALDTLRRAYILSDLSDAMGPLDRLQRTLNPEPQHPEMPAGTIAQEVKHLIAGTRDLLENEFYFHVYGPDVQFYLNKKLFGPQVSKKFELANEDIEEAGKCLALQQSTACVFHLMRVMEIGVQRFGRKLKVTVDVKKESWHQIMLHIHKVINAMPKETKKKVDMSAAAGHLDMVRIAWRNEVMHPKQTYTREEAFDVFYATRVFMISIASLV